MFLHWHHKSLVNEAVGNSYFFAGGNLYFILNDVVTLAASVANSEDAGSWSYNNQYLTTGGTVNPFNFYSVSGATTTLLSGPATYPGSGAEGQQRWDTTNTYIAVASGNGFSGYNPTLVYKRTGDSLALLATSPNDHVNTVTGVAWSPNSNWVIWTGFANTTGPYVGRGTFLYSRSGDTFTLNSQIAIQGEANNDVQWQPNGQRVALNIGGVSNQIARVYTQSGSTFTLNQTLTAANPSETNSNTGRSLAWSPNSEYLALSYSDGDGNDFVRVDGYGVTSPGIINTGFVATWIDWSRDSRYLAFGGGSSTRIYRRDGSAFTLIFSTSIGQVAFQK